MELEGRDFLALATSPLVWITSDPGLDEIFQRKNNIPSFVQFLRPFGYRPQSNLHVPDIQGNTVSLDPCYLRFVDTAGLDPTDQSLPPRALCDSILPKFTGDGARSFPSLKSRREAEDFRENSRLENLMPWYNQYRDYVSLHLGATEHESFNHPVACLIAVSTSDPDPLMTVSKLGNSSHWPEPFKNGLLDTNILRLVVLVHDADEAPNVDVNELSNRVNKVVPAYVLNINSFRPNPERGSHQSNIPDMWSDFIEQVSYLATAAEQQGREDLSPTSPKSSILGVGFPSLPSPTVAKPMDIPPVNRGMSLTQSDFASVDTFLKDFLLKNILDRMIRSIREWDKDVASTRRGLSNRILKVGLKYFGSSKSQGTSASTAVSPDGASRVLFPASSQEFIMRKLGDYAFTLRDYKYALSAYESVKKDFSANEKYAKYYAGVQEMIALSSMMLTESPKVSIESLLESSAQLYKESKLPLYAARSTLWIVELIKEHGLFRDAAGILVKMANDELDIKNPLFMEHAAVLFLRNEVPLYRKYVYHMILAGHRYLRCQQRQHSHRCYAAGLGVFKDSNWTLIEDHLLFTLGRHSFNMKQLQESFDFYLKLLRKSRATAPAQRAYMSEFLHVYQELKTLDSNRTKSLLLPVPTILENSFSVSVQDPSAPGGSFSKTSASVSSEEEAVWESLEQELVETFQNKAGTRLQRHRTKLGGATTGPTPALSKSSCAVGEPIYVYFEWRNPLQIPVPINNLFVECAFNSQTMSNELDAILEAGEPQSKIEFPEFTLEVLQDAALDASERRQVKLKIIPKREGELTILGIRYTLSGIVHTSRWFQKNGRAIKERGLPTGASNENVAEFVGSNDALKLVVTSPMPVLDVVVHNLPENLVSGQVSELTLELNNKGGKGLCSLLVKSSDPQFVSFGDSTSGETPAYAPLIPTDASMCLENITMNNTLDDPSISRIPLPEHQTSPSSQTDVFRSNMSPSTPDFADRGILPASQTTLIPLWLRGVKTGKQIVRLLFLYQSEDRQDSSSYRVFRKSLHFNVYSSLRVNAFLRPSLSHLTEFVLGVEIENLYAASDLVVRQISLLSPLWEISWLPGMDDVLEERLAPNQSIFRYFSVKRSSTISKDAIPTSPELRTTYAIEKLIMMDDAKSDSFGQVNLNITSLGSKSSLSSCGTYPFESLTLNSRAVTRMNTLTQQYPQLSPKQIRSIFPLFCSDDVELFVFWDAPTSTSNTSLDRRGHLAVSAMNLALYNPLPLSIWFSGGLDEKTLGGKALYAATARERKALVNSLLKSRQKESSPVRVLLSAPEDVAYNGGEVIFPVTVTLGNTSWMTLADYHFQAGLPADSEDMASRGVSNFSWLGKTSFKGTLEPGETIEFQLHAFVPGSGVFDVNRWRMSVQLKMCPEACQTAYSQTWASDPTKGTVSFTQVPTLSQHVYVR